MPDLLAADLSPFRPTSSVSAWPPQCKLSDQSTHYIEQINIGTTLVYTEHDATVRLASTSCADHKKVGHSGTSYICDLWLQNGLTGFETGQRLGIRL